MRNLETDDPVVASLVRREGARVEATLDLIAAENYPPLSVMEAQGSIFTIKIIEGYPGRRYHAGCMYADQIEELAIARAKELFGAEHANVQPHSGTSANLAVYFSVLEVGDRVLAMSLPHGGHLSHGHRASMTSRCFSFSHYTTDIETGLIDYGEVRRLAEKERPRMIVAGASSYPRLIDYRKMADIARDVSAYLFADMAHLAGLVAAKVIPSPVPHCDFITFSCYKTMMGGRGGVILCRSQYAERIDSAVFPGTQGTAPVSALAAYLEVVRLLHDAGVRLKRGLYVAGVMDEEFRMLGSQDVGAHGPHADQGIIGEPTELGVCPSNKGRVSTFFRTRGRAAHSSVPETGENAIVRMGAIIRAFAGYNDELLRRKPHPLCGHGRFNPGVIKGGVQVNMVPDLCELEVDRRTLPGETKEGVYDEFRGIIDPLKMQDPVFNYEITEPSWLIPPNDINPGEPVVQSLLRAYERVTGKTTEITAFAAASDAPHMGFPTVICGPGSIEQAHTTDEFVETEQLVKAAQMYLWVVLDLLG